MAVYDTKVKIIVGSANATQDSASTGLAKEVNDYVKTLDSTDDEVLFISSSSITPGSMSVMIVHTDST